MNAYDLAALLNGFQGLNARTTYATTATPANGLTAEVISAGGRSTSFQNVMPDSFQPGQPLQIHIAGGLSTVVLKLNGIEVTRSPGGRNWQQWVAQWVVPLATVAAAGAAGGGAAGGGAAAGGGGSTLSALLAQDTQKHEPLCFHHLRGETCCGKRYKKGPAHYLGIQSAPVTCSMGKHASGVPFNACAGCAMARREQVSGGCIPPPP